jgi:hypothetical protein
MHDASMSPQEQVEAAWAGAEYMKGAPQVRTPKILTYAMPPALQHQSLRRTLRGFGWGVRGIEEGGKAIAERPGVAGWEQSASATAAPPGR